VVDVDGDGCPDAVSVTGNVVAWNGLRFSVGPPRSPAGDGDGDAHGDVVLVGDWDCDGVATVAVWRPAAGVVFVFEGWPGPAGDPDAELRPARRVSLRPGGGPPMPCRG
jgi:hypothetical protein